MKPYPLPDRRQQPRIPGMTVTMPGDLDDDQPLHILPHTRTRCEELGVCQNTGLCDQCSDGTGQQRNPSWPPPYRTRDETCTPPEAGNGWFAEPKPREPMTAADAIAVGALMVVSAASAIGAIAWVVGSWRALVLGA